MSFALNLPEIIGPTVCRTYSHGRLNAGVILLKGFNDFATRQPQLAEEWSERNTKLPSFCSKTTGKAQNIELEWNGTKYTTTLTDTNGVLANYSFSADASGISFSTSGNKLTITADTAPSSTVSITATKTNSLRRGIIVWDDGVYSPTAGRQNLTTFAQTVNDPVKGLAFQIQKLGYSTKSVRNHIRRPKGQLTPLALGFSDAYGGIHARRAYRRRHPRQRRTRGVSGEVPSIMASFLDFVEKRLHIIFCATELCLAPMNYRSLPKAAQKTGSHF